MPAWALLGQYDNGSAKGKGRSEYLWLPIEASTADADTDTPTAIPIGLIRNNRRYALHSDHLGSVRRLSDEAGQTQWQWPYSAFGANPPSGPLKATAKPDKAMTAAPQLLKATSPKLELDLRYPGQVADEHSALHDNWQRQYQPLLGRYTQADPIGLAGGWNRFGYANENPIRYVDPDGRLAFVIPFIPAIITGTDLLIGGAIGVGAYAIDRMFSNSNRPPPGSVPISGSPWSGDHGRIKDALGLGGRGSVFIDPEGNVWVQHPDGSWSNEGGASDYTGSGKASGRRGKDRDKKDCP